METSDGTFALLLRKRLNAAAMDARIAIIDIGSNTVRLVVYGGPPRSPAVLLNEKVTARLGKGLGETGLLSEKAMKTALAALARFATLLRIMGITDVETVATAAARDAANGPEFLNAVTALGLKPRLLTGEEEATTSAIGVMAAFPGAHGVVADVGGGSLELTLCEGDRCHHGITTPFGTLRLAALRAGGVGRFNATVRNALQAAQWQEGAGLPLYLVGGSWRALARIAMFEMSWPLDDPHGFELAPELALEICERLAKVKPPTNVPRLSGSRLASVPDAAALLAVLVREIRPSVLVFSAWGLREGLVHARLDPATQAQSPMLAGINAFAETMDVPAALGSIVADWTADAGTGAGAGAENQSLRLAATTLALAAFRIEPNLRAEEASGWALRKRWIGIDDAGRGVLAMACLACTGRTTIPEDLARLAPLPDLQQAVTWGLAVRLARKFSAGVPQAMSDSALRREDGKLVLAIRAPLHPLYSEGVDKDLRLLADWLELNPEVHLLPAGADLG